MMTGVRAGEMVPDGDTLIAATVMADPMTGHTPADGKETSEGTTISGLGAGTVTMIIVGQIQNIMADPPCAKFQLLSKRNVLHPRSPAVTESVRCFRAIKTNPALRGLSILFNTR